MLQCSSYSEWDACKPCTVCVKSPGEFLKGYDVVQMEGVRGYFDHEDVPGENEFGPIIKDEEIFASEMVTCIGQQIGIIVADTEAQARLAVKAVKVEYTDIPGAVYSCEEAIAANKFIEVRSITGLTLINNPGFCSGQ